MSDSLRVAVAQFAPGADRDANLAGIAELTASAARAGAALDRAGAALGAAVMRPFVPAGMSRSSNRCGLDE